MTVANQLLKIPAVWMRGGTSKGLFFHEHDLPQDAQLRERYLLAAIGSPDGFGKQLNGIGGATSSTSKIVVISPNDDPVYDVNYLFGHVSITQALIDWSGNCGNLLAAVAHFAIEEKLIQYPILNGVQKVRIWQQNLGEAICAYVPVVDGLPCYEGHDSLPGVSEQSVAFDIEFSDLAKQKTLPTGQVRELLKYDEESIEVSLINAGNATVFVRAADLGLRGDELPTQLSEPSLLARIESIRCHAAISMGLADSATDAALRPAIPKVALVAPAQQYTAYDGVMWAASNYDISVRIFSMGLAHGTLTGTGAVAVAAAAQISGSLVHQQLSSWIDHWVRIAHPSGVMRVGAWIDDSGMQACSARMVRTARRLMEGFVCLPLSVNTSNIK